jgi:hypothetical protein
VTVSKGQDISSALWSLLRDAAVLLLRMRAEFDEPASEGDFIENPALIFQRRVFFFLLRPAHG